MPEVMPDATPAPVPPSPFTPLRGTNTLLCGAPGSGKTHSLTTFVEAGLELAVLVTDPGGEETLFEVMEQKKLPLTSLHTRYVAPSSSSWDALIDMGDKINRMGYKDLTEIKHGISKRDYGKFIDVLETLSNFTTDQGRELGPVDDWGSGRVLALDSASGLNMMAMALIIGAKPAAHQGEWGVAMNAEEQLLYKLCADTKCFFVLTAHLDRVMDEVRGAPIKSAAFLGQKLAPKIPRLFSDFIFSYKEGNNFFWSTTESDMDLKSRSLPLRDKIDPDFSAIVDVWRRRNEHVRTSTQEEPTDVHV